MPRVLSAPHPRHKSLPGTGRSDGFSLVLSLTVMSMLLLLCIGAAAMLAFELRVSRVSASYARARLNAMAGARIALGELQRLAGPDQRVTATADILGDPTATDPQDASYYQNARHGAVTHPRWVGVWNSGRVSDKSVPGAASGEETKVIQRTAEGYLMDSRFAGGDDWANDRAAKDPASASRRLAGWVVSGNEALPSNDPNTITPFTPIDRTKDVVLVGPGTLGSLFSESADSDRLGARARKVAMTDAAGNSSGNYAYWVADEGVKARFNLRDRFEGLAPNKANLANGGMFRLMLPQRNDFTAVQNPVDAGHKVDLSRYASLALSKKADDGWRGVAGFGDIGLMDPSVDAAEFKNRYYHDVSFSSAGVMSDVTEGGLKKDLTAYLNRGEKIPDYAGVLNSGISDEFVLIQGKTRASVSPRLALIRAWWAQALSGTDVTGLAVTASAPALQSKDYSIRHSRWANNPVIAPATATLGIPSYSNVNAGVPVSPVITAFDYHYNQAFEPAGDASNPKKNEIKFLFYPKITIWNPYSFPIKNPQGGFRVAYLTYIQTRFNNIDKGQAIYSLRPIRNYKLNLNADLEPGQAITFVPSSGQDFSMGYKAVATHPDVEMTPGLPSFEAYYVDRGNWISTNTTTTMDVDPNDTITYSSAQMMELGDAPGTMKEKCFVDNDASYDEGKNGGPLNQVFLMQGNVVLQQVNMDSWSSFLATGGDLSWSSIVRMEELSSLRYNPLTIAAAASAGPDSIVHHGFRFLRLDDSDQTGDQNGFRNTNINPFVNFNFRATRITRFPYDGVRRSRVNNCQGFGPLTTDYKLDLMDPNQWSSSPRSASPWLNPAAAGATRYALVDMPIKNLGLVSLGQLQHAPLLQFPWAPGFPVGNSFLPMQDKDFKDETLDKQTGYSDATETAVWAKVNGTSQFNNYIRGMSGGTMRWANPLDNQHTLVDWSYELNHALWDSWMTSGIPSGNSGWGAGEWDISSIEDNKTVPNSRLAVFESAPSPGYFASDNFAAYRVPRTLMQEGQFNVNSTSVVAWQSLLGAFRGIRVPTRDGNGNQPTQTPYARMAVPLTGPVSGSGGGAYSQAAWGGFRALEDAEINALAQKIVVEVKSRGPFLSLADFINRRLKSAAAAYANWTESERDYLGAVQAAINAAELNKGLSSAPGNPLAMNRDGSSGETIGPLASTALAKPEHKVKDKLTGVPGYLMQSDVLQKLGPVLAARSDTFTVRARGESDDGAVAVVELTVQRTPEPVRPGTGADGALPVNPKSIAEGSIYAGNQFFGRRFKVLATRWMSSAEI